MPLDLDKIDELNKTLFIHIQPPNVPRPSFIWNYFGHLYKNPREALDLDRIYCKVCFEKIKEEYPDASFSSVRRQIGTYSATSSTGNMRNHLLAMHQITEAQAIKKTTKHIVSMFARNRDTTSSSQLKEKLGHQLTLMCCKDLLPFSIVENEGFQDFLISNRIVNTKYDIPSRTTLSPLNLNKIYTVCVDKTKEQIKLSTNYPTITCDAWSDKYRHRSYICITLHFLDSKLQQHQYSLRTQPFNEAHTGESIKDLVSNVLNEFGINPNNVIVVSDKGANMHKVQSIINKLRYRQHELENEYFRSNEKRFNDLLLSINKAGEIIDADLASTYIDADDTQVLNEKFQNDNLEALWLSDDLKFRFHTLKKRIVTRWNTVLIMLRSYADNIPGIEVILGRLKHFDLILTVTENEIVRDLIQFLSLFESTTTILSASKSYPTISLCLLLRIEIESLLHNDGTESLVIQDLKVLLSANLDNRFPVTPLYICAFLLDPSQLKIDISRYLTQCHTTKESILSEMIKQFKINYFTQASSTNNVSTSSSSQSCSSITTTATSHSNPSTTASSTSMKRNLSVESLNSPVKNLKKLKENLIQKHKPPSTSSFDPILDEIQNYLQLDISCDDVLQFWRSSGNAFPHIKRLAQIVLAVPATSTPSERVFSTTGLILNAKRTMLLPENVGKIQMIHDNYNLLKIT
ncbi:unnamed protein product [Rotaria sp. Silwood1]|nr:unnamed protein product [Rotaria sp. Silwood1]CAF5009051.1 unnamed protein product [Rotaria sp. Silwood1]CAF5105938.1 unnamed protein product [Rotaria sp. Silwood1]